MTSRVAAAVLTLVVNDAELREAILGDLAEDFAALEAQHGPRVARRWYRRQIAESAPRLAVAALARATGWSWVRAGLAAIGGYLAVMLLIVGTELLLRLMIGSDPEARVRGFTLASVALSVLGAVAGGYVAAWIGRHAPYASALALALLFMLIGLMVMRSQLERVPLLGYLVLELTTVPSTLCGAALRQHRHRRTPADPAS